jgi:hypothetical protein
VKVADDRHPGPVAVLAVELERQQLGRALVTVDHPKDHLGIHRDRLGLLAVVEDRRDETPAAEALGVSLAASVAPLDRQLSHRCHD